MNLKKTYNKIAKDWHLNHKNNDWWTEEADKFVSLLNLGDSVLDVGCGAGIHSKYLIQKGLRVTGIDFSEKMIEIAKREVPEAEFQVLDLADVNELDGFFEGIYMPAVLLHVPKAEVQKKIENIAEKLKASGYFYIAVKEKQPGVKEEETKNEDDYGYPYQRFFSYFTIDEIRNYFTKAGLIVVYENVLPVGKTNWVQVVAQKQ